MNFKRGDVVVCINPGSTLNGLTKGRRYTISDVIDGMVYLREKGGDRRTDSTPSYFADRFVVVNVSNYEDYMKYLPGDVVRCVDPGPVANALTRGECYTVSAVVDEMVYLDELGGQHIDASTPSYFTYRFVKVVATDFED